MVILSFTGLASLTGHSWYIFKLYSLFWSSFNTKSTSSILYLPLFFAFTTIPLIVGGTIILCIISEVSCTSANICPLLSWSPSFTSILTSHSFSVSSDISPIPSGINPLDMSFIAFNGRSIPSNIFPSIPGPSFRDRGLPVDMML